MHVGYPHEVGLQVDVFTRSGVERVARHGFELARSRRGRLASITKSNASRHSFVMWDEVVDRVHQEFPDVTLDRMLVDAAAAAMVTAPQRFDVMIASNLFGDILTDVGAAIQGGMGLAASATSNLSATVRGCLSRCTARRQTSPVRTARIRLARCGPAMMLDYLGESTAASRVMNALETVLGESDARTPDLGGSSTTSEVGEALVTAVTRR